MNINTKNKLVWNAVPTVFDVPNPPQQTTLKRPAPCPRSAPVPAKKTKKEPPVETCAGKIQYSTQNSHIQILNNNSLAECTPSVRILF